MSRRGLTASVPAAITVLALGPLTALAALSASVGDLDLGEITYSHAPKTRAGTLTLTASDTGTAGLGVANAGWNVTLVSSDLAYIGPHAGGPIPAGNLSITTAHPPTRVAGQQISATGGPRTTNASGALDVPRKTLQADGPTGVLELTYYGIGTYEQAIDITLLVPGQTRAGMYSATLTVTMSAGP